MDLNPAERRLRAQVAAHSSWANTPDPGARTAAARAAGPASLGYHEQRIDPEGTLEPEERRRRAEHARKAYFAGLSLKGVRSRRKAGLR
jgi:hypothetical protein